MIELTRAQLSTYVARAMVDVNMSSTPSKVIRKEVFLRSKGPSKLLNDPRLKRHPNILWKEEFFLKGFDEGGKWRCASQKI
jgi:hypothetical protein